MKSYYLCLLTFVMAGYWANLYSQAIPGPGDIVITEIMANPDAVSDTNGEWIEIRNMTGKDLLINGLKLEDSGTNMHVLTSAGSLILPANSYWVLGRNGNSQINGGVNVNYVYQNFTLSNSSDQVILTGENEVLIDQVCYDSDWPLVSGASMELKPDCLSAGVNDLSSNWSQARTVFGAGDKGSPGKDNALPAGLDDWEQGITLDVFPNPSRGQFIIDAKFSKPQSGEIRMINLLGQGFIYKKFSDVQILQEVIQSNNLTPGFWFIEIISGDQVRTARIVVDK